jgi:uncharacterized protein YndB with AHSA1/START domain
MAREEDELALSQVSSKSVREATGRGWEEWLEALDAAGAAGWDHKEIVAYLECEHPEVSSWWRQSIAVGYEQARGKRVVGETADVGFQVDKGERYEVSPGNGAPGASGEVRVVKPGDRLRMTWQPEGWPAPATLQLRLSESGTGKTAIHAHLEKLPDAHAREAMAQALARGAGADRRGGSLTHTRRSTRPHESRIPTVPVVPHSGSQGAMKAMLGMRKIDIEACGVRLISRSSRWWSATRLREG